MSSILSVYLSDHHGWCSSIDYIHELQPTVVVVHQPTARSIWRAQQAAPDAKIMLRSWDIDDHNGDRKREAYADPRGAAGKHYDMWDDLLEQLFGELDRNDWEYNIDQWYLQLINEPDPVYLPQIIEYTAEWMHRTTWPLGVMVASVGTFGIDDDPNNWSLVKPLEQQIRDGGHVLIVHEYWQPEGPSFVWTDKQARTREDAGNLAWRHQHIPLDVPILVGEAGPNGFIYNRHTNTDNGGWQNYMTPQTYAAQVHEYIEGCDSRVAGVALYMTDYHDDQWKSFDTTPAHDELLAIRDARPVENEMVYVPTVVVDGPQIENGEEELDIPISEYPQPGIVDPHVALAIMDVESGIDGFCSNGKLKIRFEAHIFKTELNNDALFIQHFRIADSRPWEQPQYMYDDYFGVWISIHDGEYEVEHKAFEVAQNLNREAAYRSISMGIAQIMGFNHVRVGYASAEDMYSDFFISLPAQIVAFFNYTLSDSALMDAIRHRDWREIVHLYNGPGFVDVYAPRLEAAWQRRQENAK